MARQIPKQTEGPHFGEIVDAWDSPRHKELVPTDDYVLVACPRNVCSDKYAIYGQLDDAGNITLMSWAGTGTVLTAGLLEIACQRWAGLPISSVVGEPLFLNIFGFERGQGTPDREKRAFQMVSALLMTLRGDDVNKHRSYGILPQFESKPELPQD